MKCKLCDTQEAKIESHIIPKFIFNWMKESGTGRLRQLKSFNMPQQDGIKTHMLCEGCELKFSISEKWFLEKVFKEYLSGKCIIHYNNELHYFIVSLLWRVLVYFKDDCNEYFHKGLMDKAEKELKNYLLLYEKLQEFSDFYMIMLPEEMLGVNKIKNFDEYFFRTVDMDIAVSSQKCFIYAKFPRFIFIGNITGLNENDFRGIKIHTSGGEISNRFTITDPDILDFLLSRISAMKGYEEL